MIISLGVYNIEYSVKIHTQSISVYKTKQIKIFRSQILSSQQCSVQRTNMYDKVKMAFGDDNKDVLTNYQFQEEINYVTETMQSDVIFKDAVQKNRWLQYILTRKQKILIYIF